MRSRRFVDRRQAEPGGPRLPAASLLLLGLILGVAGGLTYAWLIDPVVYVDAVPSRLSAAYREEYVFLVSQSYAADEDWVRAQERLAALDDQNLAQTVAEQLERALRRGEAAVKVRNLAAMAAQLGAQGPAMALFGPTAPPGSTATATASAPTATPTLLPTPTDTRQPSRTPSRTPTATRTVAATATPEPIYRLLSQERLCRPGTAIRRIEVVVQDAFLEPKPGVEVLVAWDSDSDRFFTGFQPDRGPGYGDFEMSADISYRVSVAEGSPVVGGLRLETCSTNQGGLDGGWRLTFQDTRRVTATPTRRP